MILEVAILDIVPGRESDFQRSFAEAQGIISSIPGYIAHELKQSIENRSRYILLVSWEKLEDHTVGFRGSPAYQRWRALLHHFYDPFPDVEHYGDVGPPEIVDIN
jgi:heme-degrading monooxygenase HmoA